MTGVLIIIMQTDDVDYLSKKGILIIPFDQNIFDPYQQEIMQAIVFAHAVHDESVLFDTLSDIEETLKEESYRDDVINNVLTSLHDGITDNINIIYAHLEEYRDKLLATTEFEVEEYSINDTLLRFTYEVEVDAGENTCSNSCPEVAGS